MSTLSQTSHLQTTYSKRVSFYLFSILSSGVAEAKGTEPTKKRRIQANTHSLCFPVEPNPAPLTRVGHAYKWHIHKPGKDLVNAFNYFKQTRFIINYSSQGKSDTLLICEFVIIMSKTICMLLHITMLLTFSGGKNPTILYTFKEKNTLPTNFKILSIIRHILTSKIFFKI